MLQNESSLPKIGIDTADKKLSRSWQNRRDRGARGAGEGLLRRRRLRGRPALRRVPRRAPRALDRAALGRRRRRPRELYRGVRVRVRKIGKNLIGKFLAGSFSAVSKRNFARKYALDSIFQVLQGLHTFAPLQSQFVFAKKSV